MIQTRTGTTKFKGDYAEIMADYTMITCSMLDFLQDKEGMTEEQAKEELTAAFERGFINAETINETLDKICGTAAAIILDILKEVIEKKEGEK